MPSGFSEVLAFWFGEPDSPGFGGEHARWFAKDEAFDAAIRERFGSTIGAALAGRLQAWLDAPHCALAFVIVLDQFTRNAFRGTPSAFSGDARALAAARLIVERGWDAALLPVQRWFCYLPFEHSEAIADQHESLRLFGALRGDPVAGRAYEWALRHHEVIARFGRFPHRNEILGRASSAQEIEFLKQPGSRF